MLFLVLFISTIVIPTIFIIHILSNLYKQDLRGKIVLVTGGSNGLGQQICIKLAEEGCKIIIADISSADDTLKKIEHFGVRAKAYKVDVSNHHDIVKLKQTVLTEFGNVDILVNNAGLISYKNLLEQSYEEIERLTKVNVNSVIFMTKCFIENMLTRGQGHIASISSTQGVYAFPHSISYSSTKFAVTGFMLSLKEYLRINNHHNIKTTTVLPNVIATRNDIMDVVNDKITPLLSPEECAEKIVQGIINCTSFLVIPKSFGPMMSMFNASPFFIQHFCRDYLRREYMFFNE